MKFNRKFFLLIIVLALFGLADATYLTISHYSGQDVICTVTKGCEKVLTSQYATVLGIPVSLLGIAYYASLFFLAYYYLLVGNKRLWMLFRVIVLIGMLSTIYLIYLQLFVIKAICQYCMVSAGLSTIILIMVVVNLLSERNHSVPHNN